MAEDLVDHALSQSTRYLSNPVHIPALPEEDDAIQPAGPVVQPAVPADVMDLDAFTDLEILLVLSVICHRAPEFYTGLQYVQEDLEDDDWDDQEENVEDWGDGFHEHVPVVIDVEQVDIIEPDSSEQKDILMEEDVVGSDDNGAGILEQYNVSASSFPPAPVAPVVNTVLDYSGRQEDLEENWSEHEENVKDADDELHENESAVIGLEQVANLDSIDQEGFLMEEDLVGSNNIGAVLLEQHIVPASSSTRAPVDPVVNTGLIYSGGHQEKLEKNGSDQKKNTEITEQEDAMMEENVVVIDDTGTAILDHCDSRTSNINIATIAPTVNFMPFVGMTFAPTFDPIQEPATSKIGSSTVALTPSQSS